MVVKGKFVSSIACWTPQVSIVFMFASLHYWGMVFYNEQWKYSMAHENSQNENGWFQSPISSGNENLESWINFKPSYDLS